MTSVKSTLGALAMAALVAGGCGGAKSSAPTGDRSTGRADYCARVADYQRAVAADEGTPKVLTAAHTENMAKQFALVDAAAPASITSDTAYVLKLENELAKAIAANGDNIFKAEQQLGATDPVDPKKRQTVAEDIARATCAQCHVLFDVTASQKDVVAQLADPSGCNTENTDMCK